MKLPFYRQEKRKTCAIACLRMILGYHGVHQTEAELSILCDLEQSGGVEPEAVIPAVEAFGLKATPQQATLDDLRLLTGLGIFPLAFVQPYQSDFGTTMHAIVVRKVYKRKIRVYDPLLGKISVPLEEFEKSRAAVARWIIVINR